VHQIDEYQGQFAADDVGDRPPDQSAEETCPANYHKETPGAGRGVPSLGNQVFDEEGHVDDVGETESDIDQAQVPDAGGTINISPLDRSCYGSERRSLEISPQGLRASVGRPVAEEKRAYHRDRQGYGPENKPADPPSLPPVRGENLGYQGTDEDEPGRRTRHGYPGRQTSSFMREPRAHQRHNRDIARSAADAGERPPGRRGEKTVRQPREEHTAAGQDQPRRYDYPRAKACRESTPQNGQEEITHHGRGGDGPGLGVVQPEGNLHRRQHRRVAEACQPDRTERYQDPDNQDNPGIVKTGPR